jgi:rhodanese-related sulfurtransferase
MIRKTTDHQTPPLMDPFLIFVGNHPLLFSALGVVIVLIIANEVHGNLRGGQKLTPAAAVRFANDNDARFVDVRTAADFKRGRIIDAINVPAAKLDERLKSLEKEKSRPLILYCAMGTTAPAVAQKLRDAGFESVYAMRGGLNAWQAAGLPLTTKS